MIVLALCAGLGLEKILNTIHTYPIWAEANKVTTGNCKKAHVPARMLAWLAPCRAWRCG